MGQAAIPVAVVQGKAASAEPTVVLARLPAPNHEARRRNCEACRARKLKCDLGRPSCGRCLRRPGTQCIYLGKGVVPKAAVVPAPEDSPERELQSSNSKVQDLENRVRDMEAKLAASIDSVSDASEISLDSNSRSDTHLEIPDEDRRLVARFFAGSKETPMNVLHPATFVRDLESQPPMLRFAVCSLGALMERDVVTASSYFEMARSLASSCFENPSLGVLQAFIVLAACAAEMGKMSSAWMLLGSAARTILYLKVDVDPDELDPGEREKMTWVEKEARRRCWWITYVQDRHMPYLLKVASVKNPCSEDIWILTDFELAERLYNSSSVDAAPSPFSYLSRMVDLFARSSRVLRLQSTNDATLPRLESVHETMVLLQADLSDFLDSLPDQVKYMLSASVPFVFANGNQDTTNIVYLAYIYHASTCAMHRPRVMRMVGMSPSELAALPSEERLRLLQSLAIGGAAAECIARKNELSLLGGGDVGLQPQDATYSLFDSSLFLVILAYLSSPVGHDPDASRNFACRRWFAMNLRTLRLLGRAWKVGAHMAVALEALAHCAPGIQLPAHLLGNDAYMNPACQAGDDNDGVPTATTMPTPPAEIRELEDDGTAPDPVSAALAMLAQKPAGTFDRIVAELWLGRAHAVSLAVGGAPILPAAMEGGDAVESMMGMSVAATVAGNSGVRRSGVDDGVAAGGVSSSPRSGEGSYDGASEGDDTGDFTGEMLQGESPEQLVERLIAAASSKESA
ncbi:hypothetical protein HK101_004341, partial [Irineochytrium annulatum]